MRVSFRTKTGKYVNFYARKKHQRGSGCTRPRRGGCPKYFVMGQNRKMCYPCDSATPRVGTFQYNKKQHKYTRSQVSRIPVLIKKKQIKKPKIKKPKGRRRRRTAVELMHDANRQFGKWNK